MRAKPTHLDCQKSPHYHHNHHQNDRQVKVIVVEIIFIILNLQFYFMASPHHFPSYIILYLHCNHVLQQIRYGYHCNYFIPTRRKDLSVSKSNSNIFIMIFISTHLWMAPRLRFLGIYDMEMLIIIITRRLGSNQL